MQSINKNKSLKLKNYVRRNINDQRMYVEQQQQQKWKKKKSSENQVQTLIFNKNILINAHCSFECRFLKSCIKYSFNILFYISSIQYTVPSIPVRMNDYVEIR